MGKATREFELWLDKLSSVEVWKRRESKECFNPFIQFNDDVTDLKAMGRKLVELLTFVDGDVPATLEVL